MSDEATVLEVRGLRKRYRQSDPAAVDDVSFRIEAGQVFGLLGPNGAGKTTIVKIIAGLVRPAAGPGASWSSASGDLRRAS